ncbi:MAG: choice-of-anchor B family protein [Bacteroidota bacterium]
MKLKALLTLCFAVSISFSFAQTNTFNTTLVSNFTYPEDINDIWGYVAPDGTEYALVGTRNGVSIVSLANAAAPTESAYIGGPNSLWRDLKSWDHYAYITNETGDGLLIVDMENLPTSVTSYYFSPTLDLGTELGQLVSAHNLYIDKDGYMYVCGSNLNGGGSIIFDLNPDPYSPTYVGKTSSRYSHDVFARGDTLYTSDVYAGVFAVWDVSDRSNPVFMAEQGTPFSFTHNAWISSDGNTLFTTDETANAPIGSYDISDLNDIQKLDEFRPTASVGSGVIPHNVHVVNDYMVTSYYTDGVVISDGHRPQNVVEIGVYDTWLGGDGGFDGCWGAYPFLPSGLILATDQSNGLFVLNAQYQRACYLEGLITDADTGNPIQDASVEIVGTNVNDGSDIVGEYKTGYANAGTYNVIYSKPGYVSQTISVTLDNGIVTIQDVALTAAQAFLFTGQVVDGSTGAPIEGAEVRIDNDNYNYAFGTNASGAFGFSMFGDIYTVTTGKWGFETIQLLEEVIAGPIPDYVLEIDPRIVDPFELNLGWATASDASSGDWVRGVPNGTSLGGNPANPGADIDGDVGSQCYMTGNGGGGAGTDDVDGGTVTLTSPIFDATTMNEPYVAYNLWFVNGGGNGNPDDQFEVRISNGNVEAVIETITQSNGNWLPRSEIRIADYLLPTENMSVTFETSDLGSGHVVEAAVDFFEVYDNDPTTTSLEDVFDQNIRFDVFPSPFATNTRVEFDITDWNGADSKLVLRNVLGQTLLVESIDAPRGTVSLGESLESGTYFLQIQSGDRISKSLKLVKVK